MYKDLWLTAVLYAGLVVLAILGLRDWQRAARCCSDRRLHHVEQRLASHIAAQFIRRHLQRAPRKLRARPAHVRRDQQVRTLPQWVTDRAAAPDP